MIQAEKLELAEFKKDEATKRERNRKGKLCLIFIELCSCEQVFFVYLK